MSIFLCTRPSMTDAHMPKLLSFFCHLTCLKDGNETEIEKFCNFQTRFARFGVHFLP